MKTLLAACLFGVLAWARAATPLLDAVTFGEAASESAHALKESASAVGPGRRLLPKGTGWEGGSLSFVMKVDPARQTYFTARFSGDEVDPNLLLLFCEGRQVGYRHLGDVDILALPDDEPRYNGRFYYVTTPLPLAQTAGKQELHFEVRATGPIWGYGKTFEQYQKPMTAPTRRLYGAYTHTEGCFVPPEREPPGTAPDEKPRAQPGAEVLAQARQRVHSALEGILKSRRPPNQMQMQFLAKAYFVKGTPADRQPKAIEQIIAGGDELWRRWKRSPEELWKDPATWNPEWFGVGPAGDAVRLLAEELEPALDAKIEEGTTRRAAWSALFQASRDWLRAHRRWLANQAMFTDVNLYLSNAAVAAIDPAQALPEEKAREYLYQAIGISPWLGSDTPDGPEKPLGAHLRQVTAKGLTRELGYVGGYGEVGAAGAAEIYDATRRPGAEGDPQIKAQLAKMLRARTIFRYPMLDEENHPAMRLATGIGWRDAHFPGAVLYAQPGGGEQSPLHGAAATLDPSATGAVQQMFAQNQFFATIARQLKDTRFRATVGLLELNDEYELLRRQPPGRPMPLAWGQGDFAFADEEAGVVAIKHGQEILFASLYWRAQYAINSLARVQYLTPGYQQIAVVREEAQAEPSGQTYQRPDWINFGFGNGGRHIKYPPDLHQALAGEKLPIAKVPPDVKFKPGDACHFAGRADFYTLRFGHYWIAMNTTEDKTMPLTVPAGSGVDLLSGGAMPASLGPRKTVAVYLED